MFNLNIPRIIGFWIAYGLRRLDHWVANYRPRRPYHAAKLEGRLYPFGRPDAVTPIDKFLTWVIIISLVALGFEYAVEPDSAYYISFTSFVFALIFGMEYIVRAYLRGYRYVCTWGLIDIAVIASDVIVCYFIIISWPAPPDPTAAGYSLLKIARLARILRAAKLASQFGRSGGYITSLARYCWPYVSALLISIVIALAIALFFLSFSSLFFGASIDDSVKRAISLVRSGLLDQEPNKTGLSNTELVDLIERTAALVMILAITTIITQIFVGVLSRSKKPKTRELTSKLSGHVIIYINKQERVGVLEEIRHLLENEIGLRIIFILHPDVSRESVQDDIEGELVIHGSLYNPRIWADAAIQRSEFMIALGDLSASNEELLALAQSVTRQGETAKFRMLAFSSREQYDMSELGPNGAVVISRVPYSKLESAIESNIWREGSWTNAASDSMNNVLMLENALQIAPPNMSDAAAEDPFDISVEDMDGVNSRYEEDEQTRLFWFGEKGDEKLEISFLARLLTHLRAQDNLAGSRYECVVFVRSFDLLSWRRQFALIGATNVEIVALELYSVLAAYHEIRAPGAILSWLGNAEKGGAVLQTAHIGTTRKRWYVNLNELQTAYDKSSNPPGKVIGVQNGGTAKKREIFCDKASHRLIMTPQDLVVVSPLPAGS